MQVVPHVVQQHPTPVFPVLRLMGSLPTHVTTLVLQIIILMEAIAQLAFQVVPHVLQL